MEVSIILLCALFLPAVSAYSIICGEYTCHGSNPYCCWLDSGEQGCCWETFVYQLWWFWLIWVVIFFLVLGCSLACWRQRRRSVRYVVMANSEYPTYGTVVHSAHTVTQPVPNTMPPSAPVGPPSYAASEATKPPPYSG